MTFPIQIHSDHGQFTAFLLGDRSVYASAATRDAALAALAAKIDERLATGELATLTLPKVGPLAFAGSMADDPWLAEIREEIYRQRDAEPRE